VLISVNQCQKETKLTAQIVIFSVGEVSRPR